MNITKEKITGYIGSGIFCLLLLLILYFTVLRTEAQTGEEGILVNFGNVDWAAGTFEPQQRGESRVVPQEATSLERSVPQQNDIPPAITQTTEETVAIEAAKQEEEKRRLEQERAEQEQLRLAEEQRLRAEEEKRQREAINQQMAGAFGVGSSTEANQGTAESGTGNQGSSEGNAATGAYTGVGGYGEFDLGGRSIGEGGLPRPSYSVQEEGKIVIAITVNPTGSVVAAQIGRGTNIDNATLRNSALEAARKAKFNSISGTNNQSGTITYHYSLK